MKARYEAHSDTKLLISPSSLLNSLRHCLNTYGVISLVRVLRRLVHFGPWRVAPIFLIQQLRPITGNTAEAKTSLLETLDADIIAQEVRHNSVAIAGVLPAEFINCLQSVTDNLPVDDYQLIHHIDENVRQLSNDPAIKNVLRAYFKCEPVLLEATLVITELMVKGIFLTTLTLIAFSTALKDPLPRIRS